MKPEEMPTTAQAIFDHVVTHLRKQNAKSSVAEPHGDVCVYRSPDGLMCAAGCLIPDELYHPTFEHSGFVYVLACDLHLRDYTTEEEPKVTEKVRQLREVYSEHKGMISEMQKTHDKLLISDWEGSFRRIAADYDLQYAEPV